MGKTSVVYRSQILSDFERLSKKNKKEAADFITYLRIKDELEATKTILDEKGFIDGIIRGERDFEKGRYKKWAEVKEDV